MRKNLKVRTGGVKVPIICNSLGNIRTPIEYDSFWEVSIIIILGKHSSIITWNGEKMVGC